MASFWTVLQILSLSTLKNTGRSVELLNKLPKSEISSINRRSLWTQKKDSKVKCSLCKKQSDNPLISKGGPSKCLEGQNDVNQNLEPCKKESFWAYLFGGVTKAPDSAPDPCTCRLAYKYKKSCREEDPRLCDHRYSTTPGDVLIYTEFPQLSSSSSPEPQPQPPPAYKIPSAVTCKRIADAVAEHTCVHFCQNKVEDCKGNKCSEPKPFRIPYDEFKPVQRLKEPITCGDGKCEDVIEGIRNEMYPCGFPSITVQYVDPEAKPKKFLSCPSSSEDESDPSSCKSRKKLSRIDRLKKLTAGKQGMYHPLR